MWQSFMDHRNADYSAFRLYGDLMVELKDDEQKP